MDSEYDSSIDSEEEEEIFCGKYCKGCLVAQKLIENIKKKQKNDIYWLLFSEYDAYVIKHIKESKIECEIFKDLHDTPRYSPVFLAYVQIYFEHVEYELVKCNEDPSIVRIEVEDYKEWIDFEYIDHCKKKVIEDEKKKQIMMLAVKLSEDSNAEVAKLAFEQIELLNKIKYAL